MGVQFALPEAGRFRDFITGGASLSLGFSRDVAGGFGYGRRLSCGMVGSISNKSTILHIHKDETKDEMLRLETLRLALLGQRKGQKR